MSTRRSVLVALGAVALAGCSSNSAPPAEQSESAATDNSQDSNSEANDDQRAESNLSGEEVYFNWIHGEDEQILEEVQGTGPGSISFQAIDNALEEGIEQGRDQAIANALETASQQYTTEFSYEDRHRHILSALHQTLEQKEGEQWDFQIFSNMNYTQTVGETIQYSEIKVQTGDTTDSGHQEYSIINAALSPDTDHATHVPGENKGSGYQRTMWGVRNSSNDVDLPPHDTEAIRNRIERGAPQSFLASGAALMGYQLFAGGSKTDPDNFQYRPDKMLVPASKEIHKTIDEINYEQGDRTDENGDPIGTHGRMDLQLAINERYFNEGYDEVDGPVIIDDLEETEDGWDFTLREEPNWNYEQGYPSQAS